MPESDVLNTPDPNQQAERQAQCGDCREPQNAGVTACLINGGQQVSCLLRLLVIDPGAAESAYIG